MFLLKILEISKYRLVTVMCFRGHSPQVIRLCNCHVTRNCNPSTVCEIAWDC